MNAEEYKGIISKEKVIDFYSLEAALIELKHLKNDELLLEVERIKKENKIEKPERHLEKNNPYTDYFRIDLNPEQIGEIINMFGTLEADSVGVNGKITKQASFYGSLLDKWNNLPNSNY